MAFKHLYVQYSHIYMCSPDLSPELLVLVSHLISKLLFSLPSQFPQSSVNGNSTLLFGLRAKPRGNPLFLPFLMSTPSDKPKSPPFRITRIDHFLPFSPSIWSITIISHLNFCNNLLSGLTTPSLGLFNPFSAQQPEGAFLNKVRP